MVTQRIKTPFEEKGFWRKQRDIFVAFFRSGILGFGGGPSAIPLVKREVVDMFHMMTDEQFSDVLSIANTLPGPINTKMSGYIGYRAGGWCGMVIALMATILPTVVLMIVLLNFLGEFKDFDFVKGMTNGVVPIVAVMLGVLTWEFLVKAKNKLGWKTGLLILAASFLAIVVLGIHPGIVITALLILALALPVKKLKGQGAKK